MERCVWWVFIYPVAMHGPCGHVCAKVVPFTWLLPMTTLTSTVLLPLTTPNYHWTTMTTDSEPPDQPNRQMTTMDGNQLVNGPDSDNTGCHHCKFRWGPCLPSLSPFFTWEPRGHITISNVETNFRFPFANNIAHPWSVPHIAVASLCLQGGNGFFYLIYIVRFLSR